MSMSYITRQDDMLDWICWRHYGKSSGFVEAVYEANPDLSSLPLRLPAGVLIVLPTIISPSRRTLPRLWG